MKYGYALLAKFGLYVQKSSPDVFDLRLQRIGNRERRARARCMLFRQQPQPLEA